MRYTGSPAGGPEDYDMDAMRLWYHPESDSLFISDAGEMNDVLCEDVTNETRFRIAALAQGLNTKALPPLPETKPESHIHKSTMATAIVESYKRWERKPADLYPTPVDATESLMPLLKACGVKRVWEPACGDGRMARVLEWHGIHVDATDLRPDPGFGHGGLDFLNDDPEKMWGWKPEPDWIITNPPFSLAEQFIRKALTITPNVAMLVKQSYWNTKGRLTFFGEHRPKFFLPMTWRLAFLPERGQSPLMDCAWCVWTERGDDEICAFEPLPKRVYPGYHGKGFTASLANCGEALDELAAAIGGWTGLVDARNAASVLAEDDDAI